MNKKLRIATGITSGALLLTTLMPVYQLKGESNFINLFGLFDLTPLLVLMVPALCITLIAICVWWRAQFPLIISPLLGGLVLFMLYANSYTNEAARTPEPYTSFTILAILSALVLMLVWCVTCVKLLIKYRKLSPEQRLTFPMGVEQRLAKMDTKRLAKEKKKAHSAAAWWLFAAGVFMFPLESYIDPETYNIEPGVGTTLRLLLSIAIWSAAAYLFWRKPAPNQVMKISTILAAVAIVPLFFIGQEASGSGFNFAYIYTGGSVILCLMPILTARYARAIDNYKPKTK